MGPGEHPSDTLTLPVSCLEPLDFPEEGSNVPQPRPLQRGVAYSEAVQSLVLASPFFSVRVSFALVLITT